jgi:hypothetical protein
VRRFRSATINKADHASFRQGTKSHPDILLDNQHHVWLKYKRLATNHVSGSLIASLQETMKNRLSFLLIATRTGVQRRFSIDKKIFYFFIFFLMLLIGGGAIGVWKASENLELSQAKDLLETEQQQMQTISKTIKVIEQEEIAIHDLLGIRDNAQASDSESDES